MSYRARLAVLDHRLSLIQPARSRLILLTGQSSFRSSRLSAQQLDFLTAVAPPQVDTLLSGFPYHSTFDSAAPPPGLIAASLRNAQQVWWSLFSPEYRRTVAAVLQPILDCTSDSLSIVTGSCGLQLLASAWPLLTVPQGLRLHVVALGPALLHAAALPPDIFVLQGKRDFWSRVLYRGRIDAVCDSGHLDYWTSPDVRQRVGQLLRTSRAAHVGAP